MKQLIKLLLLVSGMNLYAQTIDSILPLHTTNWHNTQCGVVQETNNMLEIHGADYRIGADVQEQSYFNFQNNAEIFINFKYDPHGYSFGFIGTSVAYFSLSDYVLRSFSANDDIYTHIKFIAADSTAVITVSDTNYDNLGGNIVYNNSRVLTSKQWDMLTSTKVRIGFNDNYGGVDTNMKLVEVKLKNVIPVDYSNLIQSSEVYDFEDGQIPNNFTFTNNQNYWQVIDTAGYNSTHSLYAEIPVNEESTLILDVNNTIKVSFDIKYKSETHKYMRFMVDSLMVSNFDAYNNTCWRHYEWQFNNFGPHRLIWKVAGTQYDQLPGQIWIDNIKVDKGPYTYIPDINFENALSAYDDIPGDHQVPTMAIDTITFLQIDSRNISDLTGLQDFQALGELWVSNNNISSIDISPLQNLFKLLIRNNQLTSIDVSQNPGLKVLAISTNNISNIDVSNNPVLYYLELNDCNFTQIDVSNNPLLAYLYVIQNNLTNLDVTHNPSLFRLNFRNNQISQIDLSHNTNLRILNISNNPISQIDFSNNPLLWFYANNTLLTSVDLSAQSGLVKIGLHDCPNLSYLDLRNGNNTNITEFDARNNPDLSCIFVDDPAWWQQNFPNQISSNTHYVADQNECDSVSITEYSDSEYRIYPNPATDFISVDNSIYDRYAIYSLDGKLIKKDAIDSSHIPVSDLTQGIYLIKFNDKDIYTFIKE